MTGGVRAKQIWWATWPGSLAMGVLSLLLVGTTGVGLLLLSLLGSPASGTDLTDVNSPSTVSRVLWAILGVACFALPVAVVMVARRKWLGWMLVLFALSIFVLASALWAVGIL